MIAKVAATIVTVERTKTNGLTSRIRFVATMRGTASATRGRVPTQYFDQKRVRTSMGEERSSHIIRPSRDMAGKTKRAAMAATTKPARPRLRNETTLMRKKETCSPV